MQLPNVLVVEDELHQGRRAREGAFRKSAQNRDAGQRELAQDHAEKQQAEHQAEHQIEQIVAGVDRGEAHANGDEDERFALAGEMRATTRLFSATPATLANER